MSSILEFIKYQFKNTELLREALTHPSTLQANNINYERLEFLGDAVLNMVISDMLFYLFPLENEGNLAKRKSALICKKKIVEIAQFINLGQFIIMSEGEKTCGGKENLNNLENALEALIGAIYIDGGIQSAKEFILQHWESSAKRMLLPPQDAKTTLQELAQTQELPIPNYRITNKSGLDHCPIFTVEVSLPHYGTATATGNSKKSAEQKAAELMLQKIKHNNCSTMKPN
ncbi:ribonuclease III [Neoehrlichia mikurensis]|uniref:Ribonuclease 3 n=1 Tax=Neoehrlichia mikurensis TaxID=89586 RepID=A0A9Q9C0W9_9RICK|nr:ribonuclease III [Neoehrlichia mikurensis]QXK91642.1 ribonuclease III [Neoehrlichia mikurensis]QXK92853.1 ribonuclease III [Neoehrlichia mikurensis]QXK93333.1 ribonuclease III [Neoehrlichia mikurensis]UTO55725.1 ribonuclease III [Neoehrlichia mikurensis]UTO56642.1 ribonuclease III [Neoehrlichia mikurensis]